MYDWTDMPKVMSYEDFKKKGYYVVPAAKKNPNVSLRWFYEGKPCNTDDIFNLF
jgi:trimethylamine-N-oxide reductase (cytochrome c)